jgi:hypothetical protein
MVPVVLLEEQAAQLKRPCHWQQLFWQQQRQ